MKRPPPPKPPPSEAAALAPPAPFAAETRPHIPPFGAGQRIGVYGGSFNPPHAGHRLVSEIALRRLALDWLWILPTPGNPLKSAAGLASLAERKAALARLFRDPRARISDVEAHWRLRYTADTLARLRARAPGARFVWIMGADNLIQFDQWRRWRDIAALMPIAVVDRPGAGLKATQSRAAAALARWRIPEADAARLADLPAPAWVFLRDRRSPLSSSFLRAQAEGAAGPGAAGSGAAGSGAD